MHYSQPQNPKTSPFYKVRTTNICMSHCFSLILQISVQRNTIFIRSIIEVKQDATINLYQYNREDAQDQQFKSKQKLEVHYCCLKVKSNWQKVWQPNSRPSSKFQAMLKARRYEGIQMSFNHKGEREINLEIKETTKGIKAKRCKRGDMPCALWAVERKEASSSCSLHLTSTTIGKSV